MGVLDLKTNKTWHPKMHGRGLGSVSGWSRLCFWNNTPYSPHCIELLEQRFQVT